MLMYHVSRLSNLIIMIMTQLSCGVRRGSQFNQNNRRDTILDPVYMGHYSDHCIQGRDVFVQLFEWKWQDVATECKHHLGQIGYCAVQVSPPAEHAVIHEPPSPWWDRYQPVSYRLTSRGGSAREFKKMVQICNQAGVRVYVDAVINHMTGGGSGVGWAGSRWDGYNQTYPAVPYKRKHFNGRKECTTDNMRITSFDDADQVRYCQLLGLNDLRLKSKHVQCKLVAYLNKLIDIGVAGFRIDAAKHIWPEELATIFSRLHNLSSEYFPLNSSPFIYHEVIDMGADKIQSVDYSHLGRVTEFRFGKYLSSVFNSSTELLAYLNNFGESWGMMPGLSAISFIDNHDGQRYTPSLLTFRDPNSYKMANAFLLAWPYGYVRIMSSYTWPQHFVGSEDVNSWMGSPDHSPTQHTANNTALVNSTWMYEHRWPEIANMVKFHNVVVGTPVTKWWDNQYQAISFARDRKGYIIINNENFVLNRWFETTLPSGIYCDVFSSNSNTPPCSPSTQSIHVNMNGWAEITIKAKTVVALHV